MAVDVAFYNSLGKARCSLCRNVASQVMHNKCLPICFSGIKVEKEELSTVFFGV